jgi:hypothetical protein
MKFIETHVFTRTINEVLKDTDYCDMQMVPGLRPKLGKVIRGGG